MEHDKIRAPGLAWRSRKDGPVPYWIASAAAVKAGYRPSSSNLSSLPNERIAQRCAELQAEMMRWLERPAEANKLHFDGTLGSLLRLYETHEESPYKGLKRASRRVYDSYLGRMKKHLGTCRLDQVTGLTILEWHKVWRTPKKAGGPDKLGAASTAIAVLKAAIGFGCICSFPVCLHLDHVIHKLQLDRPPPRDFAPTAEDIERLRAAAHEMGRHRAALAYAMQFETTTRQWDIIGQWVDQEDGSLSAVLSNGKKWVGMTWADIGFDGVLAFTPTKTNQTTRASVHVDIRHCPMVMEELAMIPVEERKGPLIVDEKTGLPYDHQAFRYLWGKVRAAASLPVGLWNRDIRAGGITEAEIAGASADDRAKLAGHSKKVNTHVYSRDRLAASNRVAVIRNGWRNRGATAVQKIV